MEYGNGIMGDMCVHMLDTTRHMLGLGWPKRVVSNGGIYVQTGGKSNISDTQSALFEFDRLNVVWQHRTWGSTPDPKYPWALIIYGEKGTLKVSPASYDFVPQGGGIRRIRLILARWMATGGRSWLRTGRDRLSPSDPRSSSGSDSGGAKSAADESRLNRKRRARDGGAVLV
jgi:predicted dehydrogenase